MHDSVPETDRSPPESAMGAAIGQDDDVVIALAGVTKEFRLYQSLHSRFRQSLHEGMRQLVKLPVHHHSHGVFSALKGIDLTVRRGETLGIVGRNGAGKSTLLQLICGTMHPTAGTISVNGRVAAILELGSGFNPEFTGHENIRLNGAILGLSRDELNARYDSIIDFADIGDFINQPVKTYSSGMMVRLAFAIQAQIEPDILIVDEAIAVGDAKFQAKCFARLKQLKTNGTCILLVSHAQEQIVSHCMRAVLLDGGRLIATGEPRFIMNLYADILFGKSATIGSQDNIPEAKIARPVTQATLQLNEDVFASRPHYNPYEYRWGDGAAQIVDFSFADSQSNYPSAIQSGDDLRLSLAVRFIRDIANPIVGVTVKTKEGITVYGANSETVRLSQFNRQYQAGETVLVTAHFVARLAPGDYFLSVGIASRAGSEVIPHDRRYDAIHLSIVSAVNFHGLVDLGLTMGIATANEATHT